MSAPEIFISAASDDLKEWRDTLHDAFERAGFKVHTQSRSFGTGAGDVYDQIVRHVDKSDFVIHLGGIAYGAEPELPAFPDHPHFKCSYTQFEYYYAHQKGKRVIAFVCDESFPYLPFTEKGSDDADRERRRQLQLAHRKRVSIGSFTGTPLDGHPIRPLSEHVNNPKALVVAVAAAVGAVHDLTLDRPIAAALAKVQEELTGLTKIARPVDISRIDKYAPEDLIGRETELKLLHDAWLKVRRAEIPRPHIITFVAMGGEGKTSLVTKWVAELANHDWLGCDAAFAWSFYSQGTHDQMAASSDLFLREALFFFGDSKMAGSPESTFNKGRRLAQLVADRRALLILDGLEPLQYAPTSPTPGELKDQGVIALLKGLAVVNRGLCVVTTRYSVPDLRAYRQTTALEVELRRLSPQAGVHLLQKLGVRKESGALTEFEKLVEDVKGHALTLNILGTYLRDAHAGDIRKHDLVKLEEADVEEQGGHAFRVMDAYVRWLESDVEKGQRALAVLRLLGLFDRPVTADCFTALLNNPAIPGLTCLLVGMSEAQCNVALMRLETAKLLTVNRDAAGSLFSLDAHPLLREYFARHLRVKHRDAWRAAHKRLYEHLYTTTKDKPQPTFEDLQPLYQAVSHGCQAGLQKNACDSVYFARILRGNEFYSTDKLGAFGADLGAVACIFDQPWRSFSPSLMEVDQSWLLTLAAFRLRALGRLTEALEPNRVSLEMDVKAENWTGAAIGAGNLSDLELTLGKVAAAVANAKIATAYADRSDDCFQKMNKRTTYAAALHQSGLPASARSIFREAEEMQAKDQRAHPLLYSIRGFRYCDLLLDVPERKVWRCCLSIEGSEGCNELPKCGDSVPEDLTEICQSVLRRATQALEIAIGNNWLLNVALDHLTLGRADLVRTILSRNERHLERLGVPNSSVFADDEFSNTRRELNIAVDGLRRAGSIHHIPRGLLSRAWLSFLIGPRTGPESAQEDLDEAWEIAERGPMRLHLCDIHLHRARLFFREPNYPWDKNPDGTRRGPRDDLAAAEKLINDCGYHRRDEELADAKLAIL